MSLKIMSQLINFIKNLASRCLLFFKMNSKQENRSDLSFSAKIITKYSTERLFFLFNCGQKMSKGFLKFSKLISNRDTIVGQIIISCIH